MTAIVVMAGSLRSGSHNRRLADEAARHLSLTDAVVSVIDLADYPLPIYDGDLELEAGIPENALLLAQRIASQDGLLLVSPEYNHSVPPLLKNAVDWVSRVRKVNGHPVQAFRGLVVGLASASPGSAGGARGLEHWRTIMRALGADVLTRQCALPNAGSGFDEQGRLADDYHRTALESLIDRLLDACRAMGRHG